MKLYDISVVLSNATATYPGDPKVTIGRGPKPFISSIAMGTHSGTHIDAPRHVFARGRGIESFSFSQFMGPCRVLDCTKVKGGITAADLRKARVKKGERILLKTSNSRRGFKKFYPDYVYLSPDGAKYLAARGAVLVGIDAWSIKQRGNQDNRPHIALLKHTIVILETIDLSKVQPGAYMLILLPLRIQNSDGAPSRAVLIQD